MSTEHGIKLITDVVSMLSVAAPGDAETHPKIKSAYAAQMFLASYFDELVGYSLL